LFELKQSEQFPNNRSKYNRSLVVEACLMVKMIAGRKEANISSNEAGCCSQLGDRL
jgi:hypothetical protein